MLQRYQSGVVIQVRPRARSAASAAPAASRSREESVDDRSGPAHVGAERPERAQVARERRGGEVVRRERGEVRWRQRCGEPGSTLRESACAVAPVEVLVDRPRRRLALAGRKEEQDDELPRQLERFERRAVSGAELWPVGEEERHVGAKSRGELRELVRRERLLESGVREEERGRGVRAAAAEPRRNRYLLRDACVPVRLDTGALRERLERTADVGVLGKTFDAQLTGRLELDRVGESEALQHGRDLVLAVGPPRAHDEGQVELGGRRRGAHVKACASATKACGGSASARIPGSRPIVSNAAPARSRSARPASSSELGSVFRRWAKAASTTCFTRG